MYLESIQNLIIKYNYIYYLMVVVISYLCYRVVKFGLARGLFFFATHTKSDYIDLVVDNLRPFRVAWLVPLVLVYTFSIEILQELATFNKVVLILILLVLTDFFISVLSGIGDIHKHRRNYTGESIGAYIGVFKVIVVVTGVAMCIQTLINVTPGELLAGVGAWLAVLLLIFRDAIINLVASVQISTQRLVKEGDKIIVPNFGVEGFVIDMTLNSIKVQNFDRTVSIIPTNEIVKVPYKNLTAMEESGGRRIKSSIPFNIRSVKFCDRAILENLKKYNLDTKKVNDLAARINQQNPENDIFLGEDSVTNVELFIDYADEYIKKNKDIRKDGYLFLIRTLEVTPLGLPVEVCVFSKKTSWVDYEEVQGKIMLHLIGVAPYFGLDIFTRA